VLSSSPNSQVREQLYRITAVTRINILGEGEDQTLSTLSSPSFEPQVAVLPSATQSVSSPGPSVSSSQPAENPNCLPNPSPQLKGENPQEGERTGTNSSSSPSVPAAPAGPDSEASVPADSGPGQEGSSTKSGKKRGKKKQDRGSSVANSRFNLLLNLTEE
jgi:hypothetical protein